MKKDSFKEFSLIVLSLLVLVCISFFLSLLLHLPVPTFVSEMCPKAVSTDFLSPKPKCGSILIFDILIGVGVSHLALLTWFFFLRKIKVSKAFLIIVLGYAFWILISFFHVLAPLYVMADSSKYARYLLGGVNMFLLPYTLSYLLVVFTNTKKFSKR